MAEIETLVKNVSAEIKQGRTIGILGQPWRATITAAGDVYPWEDARPIRWYVAADDRWHTPADEVAVRQRSVDGAPVFETRVRIPGGDVIQRIWVASGRQGSVALMMEFENDSPMAIAIAIDRVGLLVSRPVAVRANSGEWPAPGLDLPTEPTVIPVGHRTSARAAVVVADPRSDQDIAEFADWLPVARGWVALSERASSFTIPDLRDGRRVDELIVAERTENALIAFPDDEPDYSDGFFGTPDEAVTWLVARREIKRMDLGEADPINIAGAIEAIARAVRRQKLSVPRALEGFRSAVYLLGPEQERARKDLGKVVAKSMGLKNVSLMAMLNGSPSGSKRSQSMIEPGGERVRSIVSEVEEEFVSMSDDNVLTLLPAGFKTERLGVQFEVHGIAVGVSHRVSFAVRWHGANAAVLWEIEGPVGLELRSGVDRSWSSQQATGEALWLVEGVPLAALAVPSGTDAPTASSPLTGEGDLSFS